MMSKEVGTYQTTFRIETWVRGRKIPRVQYTTTFSGKVEDHNSILELVRELHAGKDGQASALIEVFEKAGKWTKLKEEDPDATIILSEVFNEAIEELNFLRDKIEDIKNWWLLFNQFIDSEAVKNKLEKILDKEFESSGDSILNRHAKVKKILNEPLEATLIVSHTMDEKFVDYEIYRKYHRAVCNALDALDPSSIPTHCSKCGDELKPIHMNSGLVRGGWYPAPGSKDPLCPTCAEEAEG